MSAEIIEFKLRGARSVDDLLGEIRLFLNKEGVSPEKVAFVTAEMKKRWERIFEAGRADPDNAYESALIAAMFQMSALCMDLWDARAAR